MRHRYLLKRIDHLYLYRNSLSIFEHLLERTIINHGTSPKRNSYYSENAKVSGRKMKPRDQVLSAYR